MLLDLSHLHLLLKSRIRALMLFSQCCGITCYKVYTSCKGTIQFLKGSSLFIIKKVVPTHWVYNNFKIENNQAYHVIMLSIKGLTQNKGLAQGKFQQCPPPRALPQHLHQLVGIRTLPFLMLHNLHMFQVQNNLHLIFYDG